MMTMASIIEKETSVPEERALVASVFINRLNRRMRLQTDPTVIYALTEGEFELKRPLRKSDLNTDSAFNTYRNYGLPPARFAIPGWRRWKRRRIRLRPIIFILWPAATADIILPAV